MEAGQTEDSANVRSTPSYSLGSTHHWNVSSQPDYRYQVQPQMLMAAYAEDQP